MESRSDDSNSVKIPTIKFTKLFINGEFVDSISGKTFETIDPRTGEVIARIAVADKEDVDLAVKAAREAFHHGSLSRLGRIMRKFADLINKNVEELAALGTIDAGKLFGMVKAMEIPHVANSLRYYAGAANKIHGEVLKISPEFHAYTLRKPVGVVGHIIHWSFPSTLLFTKISPALAAGCTIVVKPAQQIPLSALYYAHLAKLAGIPDGVLNIVTGFGPTAGAAISSHMDIDAVSFTGSSTVGQKGLFMALAKFKTIDEAIERANKSRYGLVADIVTKDLNVANTVSRSICVGTIWINCYFALDNDCSLKGYKMSGFGSDFGLNALYKYLHVKSVVTPFYNTPWL